MYSGVLIIEHKDFSTSTQKELAHCGDTCQPRKMVFQGVLLKACADFPK